MSRGISKMLLVEWLQRTITTYKNAVIDVIGNPLKHLGKTAGRLEIAIQKQQMLDRQDGKPISKEMIAATKLALDAVKIAQSAEKQSKGRKQMAMSDEKEIVIDAELFE